MVVRYSDVLYQLKRPDVLSNKVVALKYLALPLAVIPLSAILCAAVVSSRSVNEPEEANALQQQAVALKTALAQPSRELALRVRGLVDPVASELESGPLADFARRSQWVGREPAVGARSGFGDGPFVAGAAPPSAASGQRW